MSGVTYHTITEDQDGQRIDRILKVQCPGLPFGLLQKLMRSGQVRIDGKRCKGPERVKEGQAIRIPPMETKTRDGKPLLRDKDIAFMRSMVIYDDGEVMAINKPHGLAVQGGTGTRYHLDALLEAFVKKEGDVKPRLVHRLDKDTSGVMLLARNAKVARVLGMSFKSRDIKKIYWALVSPNPEEPEGEIRAPLAKQPFGSSKEKMVVDEEEGKPASTWYKVIERAGDMAAFVAFWPRTGRTHQIRAHAELVGFPLIGDTKYCDIDEYEHIKQKGAFEGLKIADRLHLHAHRLTLPHPTRKGQTLELIAPLPDDLKKSWQELGFDHKWNDQDVFE